MSGNDYNGQTPVLLGEAGVKIFVKIGKRVSPIAERYNIYKMLGEKHYLEIHRLINNVSGELGRLIWDVWMKYEGKLKIANARYWNRPYTNSVQGMYINIATDATKGGTYDFFEPYQGFFHESAHQIDRLAINEIIDSTLDIPYSYRHSDNSFGETLIEEVRQWEEKEAFANDHSKLLQSSNAFLLNIIEGATNGNIYFDLYEHGREYWGNHECLPKEAFANMFSVAITNKNELRLMKKHLPESYNMFMNILRAIVK